MIKWIVRKYAVSLINDLIKSIQGKCDLEMYKTRINKGIDFLMKLMTKLQDNKITEEEADEIIDDVNRLIDGK